jgi:Myosin head (motor domain)
MTILLLTAFDVYCVAIDTVRIVRYDMCLLLDSSQHAMLVDSVSVIEAHIAVYVRLLTLYTTVLRALLYINLYIIHHNRHYAGDIVYTANGWLDKNKDTLQDDLLEILQNSSIPLVATAFNTNAQTDSSTSSDLSPKKENHKRKGSLMQESLGSKFRRQLHGLMSAINQTEVQYVRCIKPNRIKSAKVRAV